MSLTNHKTAVVYLAWLPYGIGHFKAFIKSYLDKPAGTDHKLIIAFNGTALPHPEPVETYKELLVSSGIHNAEFLFFERGQDIAIYKQCAAVVDAGYFLFLNTFSRFLYNSWLNHYLDNMKDGVGLIGTTGSYATYLSAVTCKFKDGFKHHTSLSWKFRELKYLLKIFFLYGRHFGKYPAPHIRTTGFFISKENFLGLEHWAIEDKMHAFFFENGKKSMTAQLLKKGLDCIMIDRYGRAYKIPEWPQSRIFWNASQEDLLISDNRTREYDDASAEEKKLFMQLAWNKYE